MEPIGVVDGIAIPYLHDDVDTDRLIPIRFLRRPLADGYGRFLLADERFDAAGAERREIVFNQPAYRDGTILLTGHNFGCGSAREGAVYAVRDYGIRVVIAAGYSDIFRMNCCWNGVLPVVLPIEAIAQLVAQVEAAPGARIRVDLPAQQVHGPDGTSYSFDIALPVKQRLMAGLDQIAGTQQLQEQIDAFERAHYARMPWVMNREA